MTFSLDPSIHHLNHGSFGAVTTVVQEAQRALRARLERDPMAFFTREVLEGTERARGALAPFVGAREEDLVFVRNATEGVATVLASLPFEPDDEILVNDHEYAACVKACAKAAQVRQVRLPLPTTPDEVLARLEDAIGPRTRLCLLSHVTSPTGLVLPLERILDAFEARGVPVLVDGAHAPGMVPMDLDAWAKRGLRYYTANLHKWVCAPKGTAFLWVRESAQDRIDPLVTSHGYGATWPGRTAFTTRFDWTGTDDPSRVLLIPQVLDALAALHPEGWEGVGRANRDLALAARRVLLDALGGGPIAPESMIGSLAAVRLPPDPAPPKAHILERSRLQARLEDAGFRVPVMDWPSAPERLMRVSAHRYNALEEYRALAEETRRLLAEETRA